jgi:hypothetical protein
MALTSSNNAFPRRAANSFLGPPEAIREAESGEQPCKAKCEATRRYRALSLSDSGMQRRYMKFGQPI